LSQEKESQGESSPTPFARETLITSKRKKPWLNIILFLATIFSTFFVGIYLSANFIYSEIASKELELNQEIILFQNPKIFLLAIAYSATLMLILLAHELGHYLACRYYKITATLPYFIPAPTLIGTFGAFIKIKSPITEKKALFDIGIAGPLAGFILSLPALIYGLSASKIVVSLPEEGTIVFGDPLILQLIAKLIFKNSLGESNIILHPVAFAGWIGILVTSFNLFPVGQLDGGHISYSFLGKKSALIARIFFVLFIVMGVFFWIGWFIWAFIIFIMGLKHPRIIDEKTPLSSKRKLLGILIIIIFILSFIPAPIKGYNFFDVFHEFFGS
jgi:membrane-associated protease RseP (regulator of RpoE activity)